jgi:redox-sensitive bicupin YhaK (pirin superfamily)
MIDIRPFNSLGAFRNDWLNARHHFSFSGYHDPKRMGVGALRVWNDDEIAPGTGFGAHPHQNMEIITFVRQGAITHKDSLGNVGATRAGDVQVMHAGTGITHAELNQETEATRLFQIWIIPDQTGVKPGWEAREFPRNAGAGLQILASAAYLVAAIGDIKVNGNLAHARDGVALQDEPEIIIEAVSDAEIVLVDVRE